MSGSNVFFFSNEGKYFGVRLGFFGDFFYNNKLDRYILVLKCILEFRDGLS